MTLIASSKISILTRGKYFKESENDDTQGTEKGEIALLSNIADLFSMSNVCLGNMYS